jgi:hypothetical protein
MLFTPASNTDAPNFSRIGRCCERSSAARVATRAGRFNFEDPGAEIRKELPAVFTRNAV